MRHYMIELKPVLGLDKNGRTRYGDKITLGVVTKVWVGTGRWDLPKLGTRWEYLGQVYRVVGHYGFVNANGGV